MSNPKVGQRVVVHNLTLDGNHFIEGEAVITKVNEINFAPDLHDVTVAFNEDEDEGQYRRFIKSSFIIN